MTVSTSVESIVTEINAAVRRDHRHRVHRRKLIRVAAISAIGVAALSSAALAATGAFREVETVTPVGEVELPRHVTIQAVESYPEFVGLATSNGFRTSTTGPRGASFIYHVTGGEARDLGCGYAQVPTNNIYVTSTRALSEREIRGLLLPDGELNGKAARPSWITSTSNGCPNPGIAGQPGAVDGPLVPGQAAVVTPTSQSTKILVRRKHEVPLTTGGTGTPSPGTSPPTPEAGSASGAAPSTARSGAVSP
ncbi:MAG TPA: hypothetical protein VH025_08110 [Solirubrobacteraceae bacterium]|jgi:hypothetical protein|nr:hypothetical protein [Solirubrobacteraceae bacterium]